MSGLSSIPPLPPFQPSWPDFQVWWQLAKQEIEKEIGAAADAAQAALDAANALTAATTANTNALAAIDRADAIMPDVPNVTIKADYAGTVDPSSQLPYTVNFTRYDGTTNVTNSAAWSKTKTGGVTLGTITNGAVNITAISSSGTITAISVYNGITLSRTINVTKSLAAPPTGTGGGTGGGTVIFSKSSGFASVTSTSFVDLTGTMTATHSGTSVSLAMSLDTHAIGSAVANLEFKFQRLVSGVWTDKGVVQTDSVDGPGLIDGGVIYTFNDTGLSAGASDSWRIVGRRSSGTGSTAVSGQFSGTA